MKNITFLIVFFLLTTTVIFSQEDLEITKYHAFSGTLVLGFDGGFTIAHTDYAHTKPDILGRASLEYCFPTISSGIFAPPASRVRPMEPGHALFQPCRRAATRSSSPGMASPLGAPPTSS